MAFDPIEELKGKAGPLPVWGWAAIGAIGVVGVGLYLKMKNKGAGAANITLTPAPSTNPVVEGPDTGGGGGGGGFGWLTPPSGVLPPTPTTPSVTPLAGLAPGTIQPPPAVTYPQTAADIANEASIGSQWESTPLYAALTRSRTGQPLSASDNALIAAFVNRPAPTPDQLQAEAEQQAGYSVWKAAQPIPAVQGLAAQGAGGGSGVVAQTPPAATFGATPTTTPSVTTPTGIAGWAAPPTPVTGENLRVS